MRLLKDADQLVSARRGKVERLDLRKAKPSRADVERLMLGPTGSLRAPTFRLGRTLVVGFDEETYRTLLA